MKIPATGLLLEVSDGLRSLPYPEGRSLHYQPASEEAVTA